METINRTSEAFIEQYGNFTLFIKSIDELFVDDTMEDDCLIVEEEQQQHHQNNPVYQLSATTTQNYSSTSLNTSNQYIAIKSSDKEAISTDFILSNILRLDFKDIPDYLSTRNTSLANKIHSILPQTKNTEKFYSIAFLIYKLVVMDTIQSLWQIYQKCARGEVQIDFFISTDVDRKIWPKELQFLIEQHHLEDLQNKEENICLHLIKICLEQLQIQIKNGQNELCTIAGALSDYTPRVEDLLEAFVQQGLQCLHIENDYQIALIQYDYREEILKRHYTIENPSDIQIEVLQRLCRLQYDYEIARNEVNLLKETIPIHLSQHPFNSQSIVQSPMINSLPKSNLQQQLYIQYKTIIEHTKENRLKIYCQSAKKKIKHCQNQLNLAMDETWKMNKILSSQQQLTPVMLDTIDKCLANIIARVACMYEFKRKLFDSKSIV